MYAKVMYIWDVDLVIVLCTVSDSEVNVCMYSICYLAVHKVMHVLLARLPMQLQRLSFYHACMRNDICQHMHVSFIAFMQAKHNIGMSIRLMMHKCS